MRIDDNWGAVKVLKVSSVVNIAHSVPSQAMPTSVPVGQPLIRCHNPVLSFPCLPLQSEKSDRRFSRVTLPQATFQGRVGSVGVGQLRR